MRVEAGEGVAVDVGVGDLEEVGWWEGCAMVVVLDIFGMDGMDGMVGCGVV